MASISSPFPVVSKGVPLLENDFIELMDLDSDRAKKRLQTMFQLFPKLAPLLEDLLKCTGDFWLPCAKLVNELHRKEWLSGEMGKKGFIPKLTIETFLQNLIKMDAGFKIDLTSATYIFSFLVKQLEPGFLVLDDATLQNDPFAGIFVLIRNQLRIHPFFAANELSNYLHPSATLLHEEVVFDLLSHLITLIQFNLHYYYAKPPQWKEEETDHSPQMIFTPEHCWIIKLIVSLHLENDTLTPKRLKKDLSAVSATICKNTDLFEAHFRPDDLLDNKSDDEWFGHEDSYLEHFIKKQLMMIHWMKPLSVEPLKDELNTLIGMMAEFNSLEKITKEAIISFWSYSGDMVFANNYFFYTSPLYMRCIKMIKAYKECHPLIGHLDCISNLVNEMSKIDHLGFHLPNDVDECMRLATTIYKTWWFSGYKRGLEVEVCDLAIDYLALQILVDEDCWKISSPRLVKMVHDRFNELYPIYPFNEARAMSAVFDLIHKKNKLTSQIPKVP